MESPLLVLKDRRLWLLGLSSLLAALLGFVVLSGAPAIVFVSRAGFWFVLVAFVFWLRSLGQSFAPEFGTWKAARKDWATWGLVAAGGCILLVHETFGFKIVMDEIMLLGTSMSMHFDKTVVTPMRGNDIQGAFVLMDGIMDKRPLFFPFLVSLIHDVSGYRPANAFVLNGVLTFVFLALAGVLGRLLAGRPGAWLAILLFTGLPLLGHNATGGGFELLNLVMITATMLLAVRWMEKRDELSLTALCYAALLMVQVRYETMLFGLPVAVLVLWGWWKEGRVVLSWPVMIAPLLLIPYPLQHRIFQLRESTWELASRPGYDTPFSLSYIPENLVHTMVFFFSLPKEQPSSLVFSALGSLAVLFSLLLMLRWVTRLGELTAAQLVAMVFTLGFAGHFLLMMLYFWGKFDDPVIRRLSLPVHLWLLVAILLVVPQFFREERHRWSLVALAALGVFALGIPAMSLHAYSQEYLPGREVAWRRQFMAEQKRPDYLMIDNDCVLWVSHRISSTPVLQAQRRREALVFHLRNHTFAGIYVFQRLNVDPDTGKTALRVGDDLGADFELETVREERLQTLVISRISRVTAIRQGGATVRADEQKMDAVVPKDPKEVERLRRAYLENFVKQLP